MRKKNGFTLVELIAVIVILGVVLAITAVTITSVREKTLETQYKNLQTTIRTAAQSYHEETGVMKVPVLILLQNGKLEADEISKRNLDYEITGGNIKYTVAVGDPVIYDPRYKDISLNCDYIDFDESEKGKYISANTNDEKNGCDATILGENSVAIQVWYKLKDQLEDSVELENYNPTRWYSLADGQTLKYKPNVEGRLETFFWTSESAPDELLNEGTDLEIVAPPSGLVDTEYTLTTILEGSEFSNNFKVRADGKYPTVDDAYLIGGDRWTQVKTIHANLRDNESGLKEYQIYYKDKDGNTANLASKVYDADPDSVYEEEINVDVTAEGTYYIKLIDNADNEKVSSEKIVVKNIDATKPTMTVSVSDSTEYRQNHKITVTITDQNKENPHNISGFSSDQIVNYTWSAGSQTDSGTMTLKLQSDKQTLIGVIDNYDAGGKSGNGTLTITDIGGQIKDLADNPLENPSVSATVLLDNTPPSCTQDSVSWSNESTKKVKVKCNDTGGSGCAKSEYEYSYSSNTSTDTKVISDNAGNTYSCTFDVKLDKTAPECSTAHGNSSWTKSDTTISVDCTDKGGSGCQKNNFSTTIKNTTKVAQITIKDNANNSSTCDVDAYVDQTAPSCGTASNQGSSSDYQKSRTITIGCTDSESGCKASSYEQTFTGVATSVTTTGTITIYDNVNNSKNCTVNVYVCNTENWGNYGACSNRGWKTRTRTSSCPGESTSEDAACNSSVECGSYSDCDVDCGPGHQTRSCWHYNGGTKVNDDDQTTSCNASACPSITCDIWAGGVCSSSDITCFQYYVPDEIPKCKLTSHLYGGSGSDWYGSRTGVGSSGDDIIYAYFAGGGGAGNHVKIVAEGGGHRGYYMGATASTWYPCGYVR